MNTLDRYIARQYLFNVLALLVLLFCFVVAVDVSLNLDRFVAAADKLLEGQDASSFRRGLLSALLVFNLWWPKLLQLFAYTIGLALVGAMGFTFTQMVRHREMVALLAGGVSLRRVARPVLIVAAGMLLLKVVDQEFILSHPRIAPLLTRDHGDAADRDWADFSVRFNRDGEGRVYMARSFDPTTATLTGVRIWERDAAGRATHSITAESAVWREARDDNGQPRGGGGWDLTRPRFEPIVLTTPGSPLPTAPTRIETDLDPARLLYNRDASYSQSLSWRQIGRMLASPHIDPQMRDRLQRIRYGRLSMILSTLLSLVITMPFFLIREPRNMLIQSLKCAPIGIVSLIGGVFGATADVPGLPAGFAVFLPIFILIPVAVAMVSSIRT